MEDDLKFSEIKCTKLKSKYASLYSSYHVEVSVDSAIMSHAINVLMSAESWPDGIFVKRYFKPRDGASTEQ